MPRFGGDQTGRLTAGRDSPLNLLNRMLDGLQPPEDDEVQSRPEESSVL